MNLEESNKCEKCPPGYYSDVLGLKLCKECKENKYSFSGFDKCLSCNELIPHCNKCSKSGICLECNNNALSGFNNCLICPQGTNLVDNKCEKCSAGFYSNITGSTFCNECEENKYSFSGFNECLYCNKLIPVEFV